jgi:hypothetical protein
LIKGIANSWFPRQLRTAANRDVGAMGEWTCLIALWGRIELVKTMAQFVTRLDKNWQTFQTEYCSDAS